LAACRFTLALLVSLLTAFVTLTRRPYLLPFAALSLFTPLRLAAASFNAAPALWLTLPVCDGEGCGKQ